ncbi:hypothetical protein CA265_22260 [Sphingobacteriaceae bacterium GW460-11-11-14-LB5]|nr:hypothetical protein CA265_22260 [Sphingobacteriaceae bacterium GW460-11-11-14-LB5]
MSYSVQCYLCEAIKIKELYASKNQASFEKLSRALSEELNGLDNDFEDEIDSRKNAKEILRDFINGEVRFPDLAFMYGYVYEKICEYYGELISPPSGDFSTAYYWSLNKETYKIFVPIPTPEDFPEIYSISTSELLNESYRFLSGPKRENIDQEYLESEKEDFRFAFDKAIQQNKDLVFFLY